MLFTIQILRLLTLKFLVILFLITSSYFNGMFARVFLSNYALCSLQWVLGSVGDSRECLCAAAYLGYKGGVCLL